MSSEPSSLFFFYHVAVFHEWEFTTLLEPIIILNYQPANLCNNVRYIESSIYVLTTQTTNANSSGQFLITYIPSNRRVLFLPTSYSCVLRHHYSTE